jgi:hypothetical protein
MEEGVELEPSERYIARVASMNSPMTIRWILSVPKD